MAMFSNDVDVLKWEPVLFGELHLPSQVLASGIGAALSGTALTATGAQFVGAGIAGGSVIHLRSADGTLDGAYEILSVDSAAELTVSVVRAGTSNPAVAPLSCTDIAYRVSTFAPQATEAAFELTQCFGIQPGDPTSEITVENLLDTEGLRRASVLRVISKVYAMWASKPAGEHFWQKSLFYEQLYEKARQRCRVTVDLGGDGASDVIRAGGAIRLVRA
jgi:hypothetical protein